MEAVVSAAVVLVDDVDVDVLVLVEKAALDDGKEDSGP